MRIIIDEFLTYLGNKNAAKNTIASYERDIVKFEQYFEEQGKKVYYLTSNDMEEYLENLKNQGRTNSTISRVTASIKSYYKYLLSINLVEKNIVSTVKSYKVEKKELSILTKSEIEELLSKTTGDDLKSQRDEAMLQLLYATGMRVTELISLKISDINLNSGKVKISKSSSYRTVSLNKSTVKYLKNYITNIRPLISKLESDDSLFYNSNGKKLTRQGFWKILKKYKAETNIDKDLTPHTLRHSFAIHNLNEGMDIKDLKEILGHTDVATTMMYNDFIENNKIEL